MLVVNLEVQGDVGRVDKTWGGQAPKGPQGATQTWGLRDVERWHSGGRPLGQESVLLCQLASLGEDWRAVPSPFVSLPLSPYPVSGNPKGERPNGIFHFSCLVWLP